MASEEVVDEFLQKIEQSSPDELNRLTQNGLKRGGKFILLARILCGEEKAFHELQQLVDDGLVGPGLDNSTRSGYG